MASHSCTAAAAPLASAPRALHTSSLEYGWYRTARNGVRALIRDASGAGADARQSAEHTRRFAEVQHGLVELMRGVVDDAIAKSASVVPFERLSSLAQDSLAKLAPEARSKALASGSARPALGVGMRVRLRVQIPPTHPSTRGGLGAERELGRAVGSGRVL